MSKVILGNITNRIKDSVDKDNTELEYYVGGEHFDERMLTITKYGYIEGSTIGPAFNTKFKQGDAILMSRNPHLRKAGMATFDGICSDVSYIIRTKDKNELLQEFIPILFQSDLFWNFAERNKKGSTNFFLNWSDFEKFTFNLPTINVQKKICDIVWPLYEKKRIYLKLQEQSKKILQSEFIKRFGDIFNNKYRYDKVHISDVVEKKIEKANKIFQANEKIKYIDISSIDNKKNIITSYTDYVLSSAPSRAKQCVIKDDILVSTVRPNLNNVAKVNDDFNNLVASTGFCVLRSKNINPEFLFAIVSMEPFADYLASLTTGANYPAVSDKIIKSYLIPNPPVELQNDYSMLVNEVNELNYNLELNINNIDIIINNIINKYINNKDGD